MRHPARRRRESPTEGGFTLVELLVAMAIFTIFGTVVVRISESFMSTSVNAQQRMDNIGNAQGIMDRLTSEIRAAVSCACGGSTASPIASADANDITFYANLGGSTGPTEVQFTLSGTTLKEVDTPADSGGTAPNWTFTGPPKTIMVSTDVVNDATNPLFTYFDQSGTQITTTPLNPGSSPSSTAIESVGINLAVQGTIAGSSVSLADRVHLLNVDYTSGSS